MHNPLTLGFSPCPNDTFMFEAMVNGSVDTEGLEFDVFVEDVESLNRKALLEVPDITKISFHAYASVSHAYQLLEAGSALGKGCGPLLVARELIAPDDPSIRSMKIGIPGELTTANFLFSLAYPDAVNRISMPFNFIEDALLKGEIGLGLIIHENRFTYEKKGLKKVLDLGEYWEKKTGLPIPLGGIAVKRSLPEPVKEKIDRILRKSVEAAWKKPELISGYIKKYAQEMDEQVMQQHIKLYVNDFSLELGADGRKALEALFELAFANGVIPSRLKDIFVKKQI